ncbi:MAG: hypothetical protein K9K86_11680 [Pseudomonadales bacterium]|nr:hypothetical protein [Pseudomonadales bacterium]
MNIRQTIIENKRILRERINLGATTPKDISTHLSAAMDWLVHAQESSPDDGVSQTYLVRSRHWAKSYPETTGYIIPTFYRYWQLTGDDSYRHRAIKMADWECKIQLPDGGVLAGALGDSDKPTVFNTGQVLFGWVTAYEQEKNECYREAAIKAANWLCDIMDDDGCWRQFGSPFTTRNINVYNTRSAWGLMRVHEISGDQKFYEAAIANLEWALQQKIENGWLKHNCLLDDDQPFTHTLAYAMRGFLEIGVYSKRQDFLDEAVKIGDAVLANIQRKGFLPGRFNKDWEPTVKWSCLTGNAQFCINWGRLFQITGAEKYKTAVQSVNGFTKSTQKIKGDLNERGGIKGSHPINGGYHPWQYPNWATKFFADALMMEQTIFENKGVYKNWPR